METRAVIILSKLVLGFGDFKNGFLEIISNNKKENIQYPQTSPVSLVFPPRFLKDKQLITINAKKKVGKNIKTVAHGELILYKNNFIEGKGIIEKFITMIQLEGKAESVKINKENMGKILVRVVLEEPYEEWKRKLPNKGGLSTNNILRKQNESKTSKSSFRKINFDDNLSLLTVTKIDKNNNDFKKINLDEFININELKKLKNLVDNSYQNVLPHDLPNLIKLNQNLYNDYIQLDQNYKNLLQNINKENNEIKLKAKQTWEKYKENKRNLFKMRIDYKLKKQKLQKEINENNNQEKKNMIQSLDDLNNYKKNIINQIFGEKENEKNNNNNNNEKEKENDIKNMTEILKKLYSLGYTIEDQMNEEEKNILNNILSQNGVEVREINQNLDKKEEMRKIEEIKNIKNTKDIKEVEEKKEEEIKDLKGFEEKKETSPEEIKTEDLKQMEDDEHLGEKIVALIERDVNDLYSRKLIEKMKIDQINSITYSFATNEIERIVSLRIQKNNLVCSNGQTFAVWLISNFNS